MSPRELALALTSSDHIVLRNFVGIANRRQLSTSIDGALPARAAAKASWIARRGWMVQSGLVVNGMPLGCSRWGRIVKKQW